MPIAPFIPLIAEGVNQVSKLITNAANRKKELEDWNRVNEYNTPKEQMKRFKEAGLNPHLIYGQTTTAQPVKSSDYLAPQINPENANVTAIHQNLQQQKLQNETMQEQLETADLNQRLIEATILKTNSETDWKNVNTENLKSLSPYNVDIAREKARLTGQMATNATVQNEILSKTVEKIKSDTNLNSTRKDAMVAQMEHLQKQDFWNALSKAQQIKASNVMIMLAKTSDKLKNKEINKIEADQVFRQSELMLKSIGLGVNGLSFLKSIFIN